MGWQKAGSVWARETKDGRLYVFNFRKDAQCNPVYEWLEVDKNGKALEPDAPGGRIASVDMIEQAKVRPATDYYRTPNEDFAESIRLLRESKVTRENFKKECPELSQYVEEFDKKEIVEKFGTDWSGNPKYVRQDDGTLIQNPQWSDPWFGLW